MLTMVYEYPMLIMLYECQMLTMLWEYPMFYYTENVIWKTLSLVCL